MHLGGDAQLLIDAAMTTNIWKAFSGLLARGEAQVGEKVFVRDGVIETQAPNLPLFQIEID